MTDQADEARAAPLRRSSLAIDRPAGSRQWRRWRRYWLRDPLLALLNIAIHHGGRLLPTEWGSSLGEVLGRVNGRYRFRREREMAERVYRSVLAGASEREAREAIDRLFATVGRVMLEFSMLDRLWREGRIAVTGGEHLLAARAASQPVIVMGLHLNNWEAIGPSLIGLGLAGFKFIYQPPVSRFDHRLAVAARTRYGATMLRPGVAAARIARRLLVDEKGVLLIYADDERKGRIGAPLFGRPIPHRANLATIARLAWASGAAVIPAYAERTAGAWFQVNYLPPVTLAPPGDDPEADLAVSIRRLDDAITPIVRDRLDEWYMLLEWRVA